MSKKTSPLHPNAIVVAVCGLIAAALVGMKNSWEAGVGLGLFALVVVIIVNSILRERHRKYGEKNS